MEQLHLFKGLLQNNKEAADAFDSLLVASKLMGYTMKVKKLDHKKNVYYAVTFNKSNKEVHLDFSFTLSGDLMSICTCNGDCKPIHFSSKEEMFIKTIHCFRELL